jgi:hypothetical protein
MAEPNVLVKTKTRKKAWNRTTTGQIRLIKACLAHFPWNADHGEVCSAWEKVVTDTRIIRN